MQRILLYLETEFLVNVCKANLFMIPYDENWLSVSLFIREERVGRRQILCNNLKEIKVGELREEELVLPRNLKVDTLKFLEHPTFKLLNSSRCFHHTEGDGKLRGVNLKDKILVYKLIDYQSITDDLKNSFGCQDIIVEWNPELDFVGYRVLMDCQTLKSISFIGVEKIYAITDDFLRGTESLKRVSFERFMSVEEIYNNFMRGSGVTSVSFKGFEKLRFVGDHFMFACKSLKQISFQGLNSLRGVGGYFLCSFSSLKNISFEGLESLQFIGKFFLSYNDNLKSISLKGLGGVKKVGDKFLSGCPKLRTLEFEGVKSVGPFQSKIQKLPPNIILHSEVNLDEHYFLLLDRLNSEYHTVTLPYEVYQRISQRYSHLKFQVYRESLSK